MVTKSLGSLGQLIVRILTGVLGPGIGQDWNYLQNGNDWGPVCSTGSRQSPININTDCVVGHYGERIHFVRYDMEIPVNVVVDAAHYTVLVTPIEAQRPAIYGGGLPDRYVLDSMHFHWPAEHTINGIRNLMEAHLVHRKYFYADNTEASADPQGIVVFGVLYTNLFFNSENYELNKIGEAAARSANGSVTYLNFFRMLPHDKYTFYRYNGSLTTPDCAESVIWTVFSNLQQTTREQVSRLRRLLGANSNVNTYRNTQPINGRRVEFWATSNYYENNILNYL